jgi:RimJ/RimL family protein N-acetyltransferase
MKKPILLDFKMPITTSRLLIRPPIIGEGAIINQAVLETYNELKDIMPWAKTKPTIDDSEEFVRQAAANWILKNNDEPYLPLFIFKLDDNSFVGSAGYHHMDWQIPAMEIGYWTRASEQNKGYMTEAIKSLVYYAFNELKLKRLEIRCDINNFKSKKIAVKLDFTLEATLKNHRINPKSNQVSDTLIYVKYDLGGW